ncbi:hypothetical protein DDE82_008139 [Stemphylium lycopersici]|nr:hypothetical protein DDE82_008139 [Stemphylium lycopersici]
MYALTLILATTSLVSAFPASGYSPRQTAQVASVDRHTGPGCTGTVCNKAGSGDLWPGCNAITDACQNSVSLNYANAGCKLTIFTDSGCSSAESVNVAGPGLCYDLRSPIKSIRVTC